MMPKMDGITVLKKIRQQGNPVPVLMLTAKSEIDDRVLGLDSGADDYLSKPFDTKELLARIRSITRRKTESTSALLQIGNISLNCTNFELSTPKGSIRLSNKEFQMLEMMIANRGQLISTERFMEKIWGYDSDTEINVVWVYMSYLRKNWLPWGRIFRLRQPVIRDILWRAEMIKNLRKKFTLVAMGSMFLVLATIMVIFNLLNYIRFVREADRTLHMIAENDGRFPMPAFQENEPGSKPADRHGLQREKRDLPKDERDRMSPEAPYRTRYFSAEMDETGSVLFLDLQHIAAVSEEEAKQYAREIFRNRDTAGFLDHYRYMTKQEDNRRIVIFLDKSEEIKEFRTNLLTSLLVSGGGLLAVFVLVLVFSGIVFRPVAESYEKQKRFITDASHEIKTPLTIIDANMEVIEMERGEDEWTKSTRKQVRRLADLTRQLITLTKLEEGEIWKQKSEVSLSKVVTESVQSFESVAKTCGKAVEMDVQEQITIMGNEKSIQQLCGILMDNALKYSLAGSTIRVSLMRKGKRIHFEVYNETEAVPKGNLDILFERFYRLDVSRNSETGGSGIGLSVARAIVKAYHGRIRARSEDGKSICVVVELLFDCRN